MVEKGIYEHYKGKRYEVLELGLMEETQEPVVIYQTLYENPLSRVWVRTVKNFEEQVEVDGKLMPRFRKIESE